MMRFIPSTEGRGNFIFTRHPRLTAFLFISCLAGAILGGTVVDVPGASPCRMVRDTVLAKHAVGPSWIRWQSPCLPNANLIYVEQRTWDIWVMDEWGGNKRCLTCYDKNILGVNFPLDEDRKLPRIHWKGDPESHPTQPIIFFKAENEHSDHRALKNTPSIGWDNDLWALNVCTRRYTRLTQLQAKEGIQHTALSPDGEWYVYPLRYKNGVLLKDFGYVRMVFNALAVDERGDPYLEERFEIKPNGEMYYEPHDIRRNESGSYTLLYTAGSETTLDPYRYDWNCAAKRCSGTNRVLQKTPSLHEEFTMFSPSGKKIAWMRGPALGFGYHADLYVSNPDFEDVDRITWYNDCETWPNRCKSKGAQLSRLTWNDDGTGLFYGLWVHEGPMRMGQPELHRLDLAGDCDSE